MCQPLVAPRSKKGLHSRSSPKILAKITHKEICYSSLPSCSVRPVVFHTETWFRLTCTHKTSHRLISPGGFALLHPLLQYLHVICSAVSASDPRGSSLGMDCLPFHTVQVPVAPGPEYHRATSQSLQYSKVADRIAAGKLCPVLAARIGEQSLQVGDRSAL